MKIRMGFVSNSSSSSFCIYGTSFEPEDILNFILPQYKSMFSSQASDEEENEENEIDRDEIITKLEQIFKKVDKSIQILYCNEYGSDTQIYIGREYYTIKNSETGASFRQGIINSVKKIFKVSNKDFYSTTVIDEQM